MSKRTRMVAAALRRSEVLEGIAQLFVDNMRKHIDEGWGRGQGGTKEDHAPLKPLFGQAWRKSKPKDGYVGTRKVSYTDKNGKKRKRTEYKIEIAGYRNGGHALRNTGDMYRRLNAKGARSGNGAAIVLRGPKYALFQDRGFTTSGPNYIPLSRKGTRKHATGANPATEGLMRGRDYFIAKRGVTVPSRPFLLPTSIELHTISTSIFLTLKSILKGK